MSTEPVIRRGASTSPVPEVAVAEIHAAVYDPDAAITLFFCSPAYDLDAIGAQIRARFGDAPVIGCTTAGEITPVGYIEGSITAVSLGGSGFRARSVRVDHLSEFAFAQGDAAVHDVFASLRKLGVSPSGRDCFGFLISDGLSMQEEALVSAIYRNLGTIQLFGGSAGDGTRFGRTLIYHEGRFRPDCAVFTVVQTDFPFRVFKTEHFVSDLEKMVVTQADPSRRIVTEINGEPAGREYARVVGLEVDKLTPFIFARHPVVVRVGGALHVRSIQKVNDDESLTFFCAIDEGIVLTVARGVDMVDNLQAAFGAVRADIGEPALVLGCDCILRLLEAQQTGIKARVGEVMRANNVVGFSTYGEQLNAMHVNQTFTGVAIGRRHG